MVEEGSNFIENYTYGSADLLMKQANDNEEIQEHQNVIQPTENHAIVGFTSTNFSADGQIEISEDKVTGESTHRPDQHISHGSVQQNLAQQRSLEGLIEKLHKLYLCQKTIDSPQEIIEQTIKIHLNYYAITMILTKVEVTSVISGLRDRVRSI